MAAFQPEGWHTLTPRIVATNPLALVRFLKEVFGAQAEGRTGAPTQIKIGDSLLMVSGADQRAAFPAFLYVYVQDTDLVYQRAMAANAVSLEPPADLDYGDRRAMIKDAWGNIWQIATHRHMPSAHVQSYSRSSC